MGRPPEPDWHAPFWSLIRSGILDMEPPDHTRVRRLVAKVFTPRYVEGLRATVQRIMDELVEDLHGAGEFDLLPTIAEPLPVTIIAEMLGIPEGDRRPPASVVRGHLQDVRAQPAAREPAGRRARERRSSPSTCAASPASARGHLART